MAIVNVRKIVEEYLGFEIDSIEMHKDPLNKKYLAIRAVKKEKTFDFVVCTSEGISIDTLEEVEFETWPPKSDKKNMMKLENVRVN